jgi:hypothetical protein
MVPDKYAEKGFEISKFGAGSLALRLDKKPIFVFSSESEKDDEFVSLLCSVYLKTSNKKRQSEMIEAQ